ncbi:hypothetical protein [Nostoc sp.]
MRVAPFYDPTLLPDRTFLDAMSTMVTELAVGAASRREVRATPTQL